MHKIDTTAGIAAGVLGGVAYAACVFWLNLGLLGALIPAALVCVAVMVMAPGGPLGPRVKPTEAETRAMSQSQEKIDAIRKAASGVTGERAATAKTRLNEIADKAQRIVDVIKQDSNKWAIAQRFLDTYLVPIEREASRYAVLATRNIKSTQWALDGFENDSLPNVARQLDEQYAQLHITDVAWLGTELGTSFPKIDLKLEDK